MTTNKLSNAFYARQMYENHKYDFERTGNTSYKNKMNIWQKTFKRLTKADPENKSFVKKLVETYNEKIYKPKFGKDVETLKEFDKKKDDGKLKNSLDSKEFSNRADELKNELKEKYKNADKSKKKSIEKIAKSTFGDDFVNKELKGNKEESKKKEPKQDASKLRNFPDGFDRKDSMRIQGILDKSKGDTGKAKRLAQSMANKITDAAKAKRRAKAAEDENFHDLAAIFYKRFYELVN